MYTTLKTDIIRVVLVFWFRTFLLTKIPREGNWVRFSCIDSALFSLLLAFTNATLYQVQWELIDNSFLFFYIIDWHSHIWWKRVLQPSVLHLLPDSQPLSCGNSNRICLWRPHRWWSAFTSYPRNSFLYILWLERCH